MFPGFHGLDLVLILVVALIIFGPKKLPEMGGAVAKTIKEFKKGMSEISMPKDTGGSEPLAIQTTDDIHKSMSTTTATHVVESKVNHVETKAE